MSCLELLTFICVILLKHNCTGKEKCITKFVNCCFAFTFSWKMSLKPCWKLIIYTIGHPHASFIICNQAMNTQYSGGLTMLLWFHDVWVEIWELSLLKIKWVVLYFKPHSASAWLSGRGGYLWLLGSCPCPCQRFHLMRYIIFTSHFMAFRILKSTLGAGVPSASVQYNFECRYHHMMSRCI